MAKQKDQTKAEDLDAAYAYDKLVGAADGVDGGGCILNEEEASSILAMLEDAKYFGRIKKIYSEECL